MLNLMKAMLDPSLLKGMAEGLRQPEGRAELIKMMANPRFQKQEFYAKKQESSNALETLLLALNPSTASTHR